MTVYFNLFIDNGNGNISFYNWGIWINTLSKKDYDFWLAS